MSLLSSLFGRNESQSPWVEDSIFRLIEKSIDSRTGKLGELTLPDEQEVFGDGIRWAAGAMDGVGSFHMGKPKATATAKRIASLLDEIGRTGNERAQSKLYGLVVEESVLESVDEVIRLLSEKGTPIDPHLSGFAVRLAKDTKDRGPIKLGIALLGVMGQSEQENTVLTLGKHDEFTLYSVVALANMLEDSEPALWELAKYVDGWGRIQIVERFGPTENEELQYWLRTEGFRNSIMYEYLAHAAAVHGRLAAALEADNVSADELIGAGEIISALITGNGAPAEGIDAYDDAGVASRAYLTHVLRAPSDLRQLLAAHLIGEYLEKDDRDAADRLKNGWTETVRNEVQQLVSEIVSLDVWPELIDKGLESESDEEIWHASRAAKLFDIDTFEVHWKRLVADPASGGKWFEVMQRADNNRISDIVKLAEETIPLNEIATGPAEELGFGPNYAAHGCLDFIVQDLGKFPGHGWSLIRASLDSPVIRNRNMALNALENWNREAWPAETLEVLQVMAGKEPHDEIRARLIKLAE